MIKALIIDDEPLAHKVIENYAADIPYLQIAANAYDALEAQGFLFQQSIDLIFLDIKLPKIEGLQFLKTISQPPPVIITSAYSEYAIESYELDVSDYLLKPYPFERFLKALNKVYANKKTSPVAGRSIQDISADFMFVKSGKKHFKLAYQDILYLEAYGSYTKVHLATETILASERISAFENALPDIFLRIHKSYIVSVLKIKMLEGNQISIGEQKLPIGNSYKLQVRKKLFE